MQIGGLVNVVASQCPIAGVQKPCALPRGDHAISHLQALHSLKCSARLTHSMFDCPTPSPSVCQQAVDKGDNDIAMLPTASMSVWALLEMLSRWGFNIPRLGGMGKDKHKFATQDFLKAMVGLATTAETSIRIELTDTWTVAWPRPQTSSSADVVLQVHAGGGLDFEKLAAQLASASRQKGWWATRDMGEVLRDLQASPTVLGLFVALTGRKKLQCFRFQLLWQLGLLLQKALRDAAMGKASPAEVTEVTMGDCLLDADTLDYKLVGYIQVCRHESRGGKNFTLCTDKSSVAGLGSGLQNTVIVVPGTNTAFLAPPQAALDVQLWSGGGGGHPHTRGRKISAWEFQRGPPDRIT